MGPPRISITPRRVGATLAVALAVATLPSASAHHPIGTEFKSGPIHEYGEAVDYPLVFPLEGNFGLEDNFHAWRPNDTTHHAIDIIAPRGTPVYAAAPGTVIRMNGTSKPSDLPGKCCTIVVQHDDGWRTWYWHLNNDSAHLLPGVCDGQGWGIADAITLGTRVEAGQLLGWVGSSGNAACDLPHLHFELHDPHGILVNPYPSLREPVAPSFWIAQRNTCGRLTEPTAGVTLVPQEDAEGSCRVYVASRDLSDAILAATLAHQGDHPVVLVDRESVPGAASRELRELRPAEIVIVGNTDRISEAVAEQLSSPEFGSASTTRVAGDLSTFAITKGRSKSNSDEADFLVIGTGNGLSDMIPAIALATRIQTPWLLNYGTDLLPEVRTEVIRRAPSAVFVVGSADSTPDTLLAEIAPLAMVYRISGNDLPATSIAVVREGYPAGEPVKRVYVVASSRIERLTGSVAADIIRSPILLLEGGTVDEATRTEILRLAPEEVILLGGPTAVDSGLGAELRALLTLAP